MHLPIRLQNAIDALNSQVGISQLSEAREELTKRYRQNQNSGSQYITTEAQRQAYLFSRLPATYAALQSCFKSINKSNGLSIRSMLDLGTGPGTALWAAFENFPEIEKATLYEKDRSLINLGKQLAQYGEVKAIEDAEWMEADLETITELPSHDLIILSYSIGELKPEKMLSLLQLCWQSTNQLLLIVEPGTPVGFERIRLFREYLIKCGGNIVAPCPHQFNCPMIGGDWCHFSARVERTAIHRRLKGGALGHEDEKFSYLAVSKKCAYLPESRILRQPGCHTGHVNMRLCTMEGVRELTISKRHGDLYKKARKAEWGDAWP